MNDNILLVDDDPATIQLLGRMVADLGAVRFATSGEDALRLARESAPDLMLLDAEMPGMSGFQVCAALKADPALADVPVIFVTSRSEPAFEVSGFELGAADFIAKPVSAPLVVARVKTQLRVKHMGDELRRIATIDVLTGVANRRRFDEALQREWRRARRAGDPLSLLTQTPRGGAEHVANGVLDVVQALGIAHEASPTARHVTVSVGVACYDEDSECWAPASADSHLDDLCARCSPSDLVQAADKALYSGKHDGRARARLLDIADVDTPQLARDIAPSSRKPSVEACDARFVL